MVVLVLLLVSGITLLPLPWSKGWMNEQGSPLEQARAFGGARTASLLPAGSWQLRRIA